MKRIIIALVSLVLCLGAFAQNKKEKLPSKEMGLQLYSIRTLIGNPELYAKNHVEVFKKLKSYGYTSVEAANYKEGKIYGVSPKQYLKDVTDAGLVSLSSHTSHRLYADELKKNDFTNALK